MHISTLVKLLQIILYLVPFYKLCTTCFSDVIIMTLEFDIFTFLLDNNPSECAKFGEEMCKRSEIRLNDPF